MSSHPQSGSTVRWHTPDWAIWLLALAGPAFLTAVLVQFSPTDKRNYVFLYLGLAGCDTLSDDLNGREHRESRRIPAEALKEELVLMHPLPIEPYTAALGETRAVRDNQTIRFGSVPYSLPKQWVDHEVWCRVEGEELVIVGRDKNGLHEIFRHELSVPGKPRILDEHYPGHPNGQATLQPKPKPQSEMKRCSTQSPGHRDDSVAGVLGHCGASLFDGAAFFGWNER